jgi:dTDP-4-amino-4,6-dideoxygalactose transaminase
MPNLNAALACAQLEQLPVILKNKLELANIYNKFFSNTETGFVTAIDGAVANHWLNTVVLKDLAERDGFLKATNDSKVMTRPIWKLMNKLAMYDQCMTGDLKNAEWLEDRVVNIPSSYRP